MGIKIVTGKRPEPHITSEDDRYRNAAIFGKYVALLDVGQHLAPAIIASNTVRINSGDIVIGGVHARIPVGEYEDIDISGGAVGYNRLDAIVAVYRRVGGYENVSIEVVEGEPTTGEPSINTAKLITTYGNPPTEPNGNQPSMSASAYTDCDMYGNPLVEEKGAAVIALVKLTGVNIELVSPRGSTHFIGDDAPNFTNLKDRLDTMQAMIDSVTELATETERDLVSFSRTFPAEVDNKITEVNKSISELSTDMNYLYDELNGKINQIGIQTNDIAGRVERLEDRVTNLGG